MASEIILRDQNFVTVLAGITDDSNQFIRMFRVDPVTGRLLVSATGGGGSGSVTSVSVVTANGFAGTVANASTTPAITLTTSVTGILSGNGTAISAASVTGSGAVVLATSPSFSGATITTSTLNGVTLTTGGGTTTFLNANGTYSTPAGGGGGSPGGLNAQLQYNNAGAFGGITNATTDGTSVSMSGAHLLNPTINGAGTGLATLAYPNTSSSATITLPTSTDTLVGRATTDTLTNKTLTAPVITGATITTSTVNGVTLTTGGGTTTFLNANGAYSTPAGAVASVTNSDGTLTISPTTGAVVASLALGHANTWTAAQHFPNIGINQAPTTGIGVDTFIDGTTITQGLRVQGHATTDSAFGTFVTSDANLRFAFRTDGRLVWGNGTLGADTNLYRTGTAILNTDGGFTIGTPGTATGNAVTVDGSQTFSNKTFDTSSTNVLKVLGMTISSSGANTGTINFPSVSTTVTVATLTNTQTFTNKRITRRFVTTTQSATPAINTDNTDIASITALAQAITSMTSSLTGTPSAGDYLMVQITDNGTARAISWGTSFESTTVTLPTTTVISTLLRVGFQWNATASKWDCIAVA